MEAITALMLDRTTEDTKPDAFGVFLFAPVICCIRNRMSIPRSLQLVRRGVESIARKSSIDSLKTLRGSFDVALAKAAQLDASTLNPAKAAQLDRSTSKPKHEPSLRKMNSRKLIERMFTHGEGVRLPERNLEPSLY